MARLRILVHFLLFLTILPVAGCYHMRLVAEPVEPVRLVVPRPEAETWRIVTSLLRQDGFVVDPQPPGEAMEAAFRHFSTETGFGYPVEGRGYYYRLRVRSRQLDLQRTEVVLEVAALKLKTTYVYEAEGKVKTLTKEYPYEEYPGMFNLDIVKRELERTRRFLEKSLVTAYMGKGTARA